MDKTRSEAADERPEYRHILDVLSQDDYVLQQRKAYAYGERVRDKDTAVIRDNYSKIEYRQSFYDFFKRIS